jgi:ubiquinone/menaquinone biosynthesis C-methylase UbiE
MVKYLRKLMFRFWYWYVSTIDKKAEVLFLNYGYFNPEMNIKLNPNDELNRYSIQLYHSLVADIIIANKHIAEIGCGRGGGLSYIARTFSPASALGIDINKCAVSFCSKFHKVNGLSFRQGDAQNLSIIKDNSLGVVINVESSHRYPRIDLFFSEVYRILKPGGYFLYTDFCYDFDKDQLRKFIVDSKLNIAKEEIITDNVIKALELDDERRRKLVNMLVPRFIRKIALNFAGVVGSETYNKFVNRNYEYYSFILTKGK